MTRLDKAMLWFAWILMFAALVFIIVPALCKVAVGNDRLAPQWVKERHAYHGIAGSMEYRGKRYFINKKGERCSL
jgi:hypothetical protein